MLQSWLTWLLIYVLVGGSGELLGFLLHWQDAPTPALWTVTASRVLSGVWVLVGLWRWKEVPWVGRVSRFALLTVIAAAFYSLAEAMQLTRFARWIASVYAMGFLFVALIALIKFALSPGFRIFGVAKTVIDEALTSRMALAFMVTLLVLLPTIQLSTVATESRVEYQIKSFLVFSLLMTGSLLGFLTIFQGCWTTSQEREGRQIFLTLTKPIGRLPYLVGKWLGLVLLNGALITVASVGICLFALDLQSSAEYLDEQDQAAVENRVLVARNQLDPIPDTPDHTLKSMVQERVQEVLRDTDLTSADQIGAYEKQLIVEDVQKSWLRLGGFNSGAKEPVARNYVFQNIPPLWDPNAARIALNQFDQAENPAEKETAKQNIDAAFAKLQDGPKKSHALALLNGYLEGDFRQGLELDGYIEKELPPGTVQLQIKPRANGETEEGRIRLLVAANGMLVTPPQYDPSLFSSLDREEARRNNTWLLAPDAYTVINIEAMYVENNELTIRLVNQTLSGTTVSFYKDRGMVLLTGNGSFSLNMAKAGLLLWIRVMFIAMVAVAAGSFLSFPVATLLTFVVFFAAIGAKYLTDSLQYFSLINTEYDSFGAFVLHTIKSTWSTLSTFDLYGTIKIWLSVLAQAWLFVMPDLSKANATNNIRDGVVIPNAMLWGSFWRLFFVSTVVACSAGWLVFRRRELARVVV